MMEFSFCAWPRSSAAELLEVVDRAEAAGIDRVWVPDETFMRDPYVLLGALAAATRRIGLGVGIANPYTRHPMQIARAAATVADMRRDRIVLGMGAGLKPTRKALGCPDGDFVDITRDAITAMRSLFAGESVTLANSVFRFEAARLEFTPPQPVDIYVATTHPRAFRMAGELADGVIVGNVGTPQALRQIVAWVAEGAEAAGRDPAELKVVAWNFVLCGHTPDTMYDTLRFISGRTIANSHSEVSKLQGIQHDRVQALRDAVRRPTPEVTPDLVPNEVIDRLALVGTAEECVARIEALRDAGATAIGIRPSLEVVERFDYEAMVHEVWMAFQQAKADATPVGSSH